MSLSKAQFAQLNQARTVGGTPSIYVTNGELLFLLCLVYRDSNLVPPDLLACTRCGIETQHFYDIAVNAVICHDITDDEIGNQRIEHRLSQLIAVDADLYTYFLALVSLHSQRRKYRAILDFQPMPDLETVLPRGLLDLGAMTHDTLATWLVWRKFLYDIDNRAAQTTGYLFEPILAAAIGGVSYSARKSPIRRSGAGSGRQVDCIINKEAYEFKMRVTIAASGQGRFAEELSFAEDCALSGYRPILLVLDPTPSSRLDELTAAYQKYNGIAYVGDAAWAHLEDKAGTIMARFLTTYIREPLAKIVTTHRGLSPIALDYDEANNRISLTIGATTYPLRQHLN